MQVRGPVHGMQGVLERQNTEASAFPGRFVTMSFVGGGSGGSDAFQHAAFTGDEKKRQKQCGKRGSAENFL
jgi:hypothetical protein